MKFAVLAALPLLAQARSWNSLLYDMGLYGVYPQQSYVSFDLLSPRLNVELWDPRCSQVYTLLTPRGKSVSTPGPVLLDAAGNLVWMEKRFGEVMDMKVQRYQGEDYLTFWKGVDDGTHGHGSYLMVRCLPKSGLRGAELTFLAQLRI